MNTAATYTPCSKERNDQTRGTPNHKLVLAGLGVARAVVEPEVLAARKPAIRRIDSQP